MASVRRGAVGWLLVMAVCAACSVRPSGPPTPTQDPFVEVARQSEAAYQQGMALFEQGDYQGAYDAFERARLLSPTDDPRIDDMLQRAGAEIRPTPIPSPTPLPTAAPTRLPAASPAASAVVSPVVARASAGASTPAPAQPAPVPVPVPAVPVPPVASRPTAAAEPGIVRVPISAAASAVAAGSQQAIVADAQGGLWQIQQGTLRQLGQLGGAISGLALDEASTTLYAAQTNPPAIHKLDITQAQPPAQLALSDAPADLRLDAGLGLLYVVLPAQNALASIDVHTLTLVRTTSGLDAVTGMALDASAHRVYLSHLGGDISVVDGQTGQVQQRLTLSGPGLSGVAAAADGTVFAINTPGHELVLLQGDQIKHVPLAVEPTAIAIGPRSGSPYVLSAPADAVVRLDPATGAELSRTPAGAPSASSLAPDQLWSRPRLALGGDDTAYVLSPPSGTLSLIPPSPAS